MFKRQREKKNILRTKSTDPASGNTGAQGVDPDIVRIKRIVRRQAILAIGTLAVVVIIMFAMTSAWYTNVSKTGSLVFRTEVWGFDPNNITVGQPQQNEGRRGAPGGIAAAPGMTGIVPLRIDNSGGTEGISAHLTFSKAAMNGDEIRRRVYFYADTSERRNGEIMSRVYIGSTDSDFYSYTILPGRQLIMSDDYYNDVPVKWEWVYDVEGYYFRGTVSGDSAILDEYLRPIEYDLDRAVFDLAGDAPTGRLVSVDGVSCADYLALISATDGYAGQIDVSSAVYIRNTPFYPVSVDQNGYGVWAYLATYGEIENEIKYDTESAAEQAKQISASLNVSVVNVPSRVCTAGTVGELWEGLLDPQVDVVELTNDIELSSSISLNDGTQAVLDLNGYSITYSGGESSYSAVIVRNGSTLTIINGDIIGNGKGGGAAGDVSSIAVDTRCSDVTLSHVGVTGFDTAVYVTDTDGSGADSVVRVYHSTLTTEDPAVFITGNGAVTEAPTQLIVQGSTLTSTQYAAIAGNAADNRWGTDISLFDSTVSGRLAALLHPQRSSNVRISSCELTGETGIVAKGGTVTVKDSTIRGTGSYRAAAGSDTWTNTGDAIYAEATYGWNVTVSVSGESRVISDHAYAADLYGTAGAGKGKIIITGGNFTGGAGSALWNGIGAFRIEGGTFSGSVSAEIERIEA